MKVIIWGSRGSLPASINSDTIKNKLYKALETAIDSNLNNKEEIDEFINSKLPFAVRGTYGTNTSCVEIRNGNDFLLFDAGTGLRDFGNFALSSGKNNCHFHIFMSHLHWDHLQGFPFFVPAYIKGNKIDFYGFHDDMEKAIIDQQNNPYFPVPFKNMQSEIKFNRLDPDKECEINNFIIKGIEQDHPGKSYGYCIEKDGKKIVYSTDSEHKKDAHDEAYEFIEFIKDADLLIADAQYSLKDAIYAKKDWGHSSNMIMIELSARGAVKHLCMFHTEPTFNDDVLDGILNKTRKYAAIYSKTGSLKVSMAYDGLEIDI